MLNNTGAAGGLTVTGSGSTAQGGDNSGGTIQNTTGHGISLTNTTSPSFRNMRLLNTGDSGVNGTQVNGFSFTDGTITGAGDASDENSITFDDSLTATPNLTGVGDDHQQRDQPDRGRGHRHRELGRHDQQRQHLQQRALGHRRRRDAGLAPITLIGSGLATSAANITRATVANNTIIDFRAGVGVQVRAGNPNAGGSDGQRGHRRQRDQRDRRSPATR